MRKDVREVIDLCKNLGLDPVVESGSGHYKVRDPKSGVYLFGISSSPSDPNWRWMIMRHLRRLGLLREGKRRKGGHKRKSAIDIDALKKAQDAAIAAGHRPPTLDDLENSTEFFRKIRRGGTPEYSEDAQEEAIDIMVSRVEAPRLNSTRQRLAKFWDAHREELRTAHNARLKEEGKRTNASQGEQAEFLRIAIEEVAPKRGLRAWPNVSAGRQTLVAFHNGKGIALWAVNLIEATMDHIDGLKWGEIDESRKIAPKPEAEDWEAAKAAGLAEAADKEPEPAVEPGAWEEVRRGLYYPEGSVELPVETTENHIREKYAEALLAILETEGSQVDEKVLARLDKLAGIV